MKTLTTAPETIKLISYNIHGQELNQGTILIDFEKEQVIFPSGKTYKIVNDYDSIDNPDDVNTGFAKLESCYKRRLFKKNGIVYDLLN